MTGIYPDVIKCEQGATLYIYYISDDESMVIYRGGLANSLD